MLDEKTLVQWEEWSKRDDAWKLFVPSDLRQMLGEIRRLKAQECTCANEDGDEKTFGHHRTCPHYADPICKAKIQNTGADTPADCDWPMCGCDPHADRVIAALQETGKI